MKTPTPTPRKMAKWARWLSQCRSSCSRSRSETRPTSGSDAAIVQAATARTLRRGRPRLEARVLGGSWSSAVLMGLNLLRPARKVVGASTIDRCGQPNLVRPRARPEPWRQIARARAWKGDVRRVAVGDVARLRVHVELVEPVRGGEIGLAVPPCVRAPDPWDQIGIPAA